jgi:asparagine synthase (glutamine-hydrolysing)
LIHPEVFGKINYYSLEKYFSFKNIPAPDTIYQNISQLLPGEKLKFVNGRIIKNKLWSLDYIEDNTINENEAASEIKRLLDESVKLQTNCDVPYGAFLSGGLDSSSIVALMSKNTSAKIKTFSLVYDAEITHKNTDRESSKRIANIFQTDHYEYVLKSKEVIDNIEKS